MLGPRVAGRGAADQTVHGGWATGADSINVSEYVTYLYFYEWMMD